MDFSYLSDRRKNLEKFNEAFAQELFANHKGSETIDLLVDKVENICLNRGDFNGAIRMLKSFKNGTKRLPTYKYGFDCNAKGEWKYQDGNEKFSMGENDKPAHFRWNFGNRYTLTDKEINTIEGFLKTAGL